MKSPNLFKLFSLLFFSISPIIQGSDKLSIISYEGTTPRGVAIDVNNEAIDVNGLQNIVEEQSGQLLEKDLIIEQLQQSLKTLEQENGGLSYHLNEKTKKINKQVEQLDQQFQTLSQTYQRISALQKLHPQHN